ncbi:hypothetical protein K523DRAFT_395056, partial [Schizophyllum commune Tattone D]
MRRTARAWFCCAQVLLRPPRRGERQRRPPSTARTFNRASGREREACACGAQRSSTLNGRTLLLNGERCVRMTCHCPYGHLAGCNEDGQNNGGTIAAIRGVDASR